MASHETRSRVLGSVLGAALGDAMGAPFEFRPADDVASVVGEPWIDDLYPFVGRAGAHGVWRDEAPPGTGTDDTRYNWLLLELASKLGRMPSAEELARHFLQVYDEPEAFFPAHRDHARRQFAIWEPVCRGFLGQRSARLPDVPPAVLRERSIGINYPSLIGLIVLTTAGLAPNGQPEEAYAAAYEADFFDIGYAREAVGILAAAISLSLAGDMDALELLPAAASMDPLALGDVLSRPFVVERLPGFLEALPASCPMQGLAEHLSRALSGYLPFDPFKTIAIAFAATIASPDDPLRAVLTAVNHRAVDDGGALGGFQDIDCYGCVTGALAGAVAGADAFPPEMLDQVVESNREVYGFDLRQTAERLVR